MRLSSFICHFDTIQNKKLQLLLLSLTLLFWLWILSNYENWSSGLITNPNLFGRRLRPVAAIPAWQGLQSRKMAKIALHASLCRQYAQVDLHMSCLFGKLKASTEWTLSMNYDFRSFWLLWETPMGTKIAIKCTFSETIAHTPRKHQTMHFNVWYHFMQPFSCALSSFFSFFKF